MKIITAISILLFIQLASIPLHANDSLKKDAKEALNDTRRGAEKAARAVKEKTCEMINGKMKCAAQKIEHRIKDGAATVEDALD